MGSATGTVITGFFTGMSLILAIGPQNAFILRQGLRREHLAVIVAICAISDALLILAGTAGVGALITNHENVLFIFRWGGAAYLLWFAFTCFRSALHPGALEAQDAPSRGSIIATTLALTWLNPHVYLDTVVMLGTIANQHGDPGRWQFAFGAMAGSIIWFSALGFGARLLAKPLARPTVWRWVDIAVGTVMVLIAYRLARG